MEIDINIKKLYQQVVKMMLLMIAAAIILIRVFADMTPLQLLKVGRPLYLQPLFGIIGIVVLSLPAFIAIKYRPELVEDGLEEILSICKLSLLKLAFMSVLAGISEELLFRAFLQEIVGLWPASIAFMLAHFGFWFKQKKVTDKILFGFFYLLAGAWLGLVYQQAGIIAAAIAHAGYDYILFWYFKNHFLQQ
ncbi:MAG: type II CAAX prenyl endopeptidase Rce1 family protein [Bacillota bacterium]